MDGIDPAFKPQFVVEHRNRGRMAVWVVLPMAMLGCQSYERAPLDRAAHRAAWHNRTLSAADLGTFVARLDRAPAQPTSELDLADGVSLLEGQLVALVYNPDLRLVRLALEGAEAGAAHAGRWVDPILQLDLLRITESVANPWVITPGLAFSLPLSGRLSAERGLVEASLTVAQLEVFEAEWDLRLAVERTWIEWSAARIRLEETERFVASLESLASSTAELAARGELARTEAALFELERSQRRNELWRLGGEGADAEQRLRALLGLAPDAPVVLTPTLDPVHEQPPAAADTPSTTAAFDLLEAQNPSLARLRREHEVTEQALRLEVAKQLGDLTFGPLYESDAGQGRIGLLAALPLPFFNANRRAIAEARVDRTLAAAAYEVEYERLVGRWAAARARLASYTKQRVELARDVVPLVERLLQDSTELMRLGEGSSLVLLESLMRAHQTKLDLVDSRASEALASAELAHLIGPSSVGALTETAEDLE